MTSLHTKLDKICEGKTIDVDFEVNHGGESVSEQIVTIHCDNKIILNRVKLAQNFRQRLRGLMFYRDFPGIDGLLLYPSKLVHMLWMRFPVDLVYLSRNKEVLFTVDVLVPNKFGPLIPDAYYVLEMPAGVIAENNIKAGDRLWW